MIAIETHYIPASNTRPTRICASTSNGQRLVMSSSEAETNAVYLGLPDNSESAQRVAAQALADKMHWGPLGDCGGTKAGMVFCFPEKKALLREYQPKTGAPCACKPGRQRDNCSTCEGTGWVIDFAKIRGLNCGAA